MAFHDVMEACLGFEIDASYKDKVRAFEKAYLALGISITTKILICHVPEFIELHNNPLGQFCEQVVENCYRIKNINHPNYLRNLSHAFQLISHTRSY